jgi:hypothetical protein
MRNLVIAACAAGALVASPARADEIYLIDNPN